MSLMVDTIKRENGVNVVIPSGRIDHETNDVFEKKVRETIAQTTKAVIFDMEKLEYINSSGLGVIFFSRKMMDKNGGQFIMINLKPQIKKVFEIVKALPAESIFESIEEADRYLDAIQQKEIDKQK